MKKLFNQFLLMAALICGTLSFTSCDDLFGEWSRPTPSTPTPTPDPAPTVDDLKAEAQKLMSLAMVNGAEVSVLFTYEGVTYEAIFKNVNGDFQLQVPSAPLANNVWANTASMIARLLGIKSATSGDQLLFSLEKDGLAQLQILFFNANGQPEVNSFGTLSSYVGMLVNGLKSSASGVNVSGSGQITEITFDTNTLYLNKGDKATAVDYKTVPQGATAKLEWRFVLQSSTTGDIASLKDASGKLEITPQNAGYGDIRAWDSNTSIYVSKNLKLYILDIQLDNTSLVLEEGKSGKLTATVLPGGYTGYTSAWEVIANDGTAADFASVDAEGNVKASKAGFGKVKYTLTDQNGGKHSAECTLEVKTTVVAVTGVTLDQTSLNMTEGESVTLKATVAPSTATDKAVSWKSNNEAAATVADDGTVKAVGAGNATITVTTKDGSKTAECKVTVKAATVAVTGVSLDKSSLDMTVGDSKTLTAIVAPSTATNKAVSWKSSNTAAATVSDDGTVKAVGAGNATITVTTKDGSKTAECKVTVKAATVAVTSVTLDESELKLKVGKTYTLTATVAPSTATNKAVSWKTSNDKVATVENGKVTAVAAGKATITVTTSDGGKTAKCSVIVDGDTTVNPGGGYKDGGEI